MAFPGDIERFLKMSFVFKPDGDGTITADQTQPRPVPQGTNGHGPETVKVVPNPQDKKRDQPLRKEGEKVKEVVRT